MNTAYIGWFLAIVSGVCIGYWASVVSRARKPKSAEPNELKALVQQERVKQALPLVTMIAMNLPADVGSVTLTLHYGDESLTLECGRPQRMEVQP